MSGQLHAPAAIPPGKEPSVPNETGSWLGPTTSLHNEHKLLPLPDIKPQFLGYRACSTTIIPTELPRPILMLPCLLRYTCRLPYPREGKVHPLYEPVCIMSCVSNLTVEMFYVRIFHRHVNIGKHVENVI
jgi:hypothetical protein